MAGKLRRIFVPEVVIYDGLVLLEEVGGQG